MFYPERNSLSSKVTLSSENNPLAKLSQKMATLKTITTIPEHKKQQDLKWEQMGSNQAC